MEILFVNMVVVWVLPKLLDISATPVLWQPHGQSVAGIYHWWYVLFPSFCLSCLPILPRVLGRGADWREQVSLILSVLRNQDCIFSLTMIFQNLSEAGAVRHSNNYSFYSFLLVMQMFQGKCRDGIAADFCVVSTTKILCIYPRDEKCLLTFCWINVPWRADVLLSL